MSSVCSSMDIAVLMKDGQTLLENRQYDSAETIFQKVITLLNAEKTYPERIQILCEAYNNIGFIFYKKVEFCKAVEQYNESIKLNPSYGIAYYNRGTVHYRLGFYEIAVKDFENAVLFQPGNIEFKTGLKECKYALKLTSI